MGRYDAHVNDGKVVLHRKGTGPKAPVVEEPAAVAPDVPALTPDTQAADSVHVPVPEDRRKRNRPQSQDHDG